MRRRRGERPIHVAQVGATVDGGLWIVQVALGLRRRGFEVTAIIDEDGGGTASALRKAGIPYVALSLPLFAQNRVTRLLPRLRLRRVVKYAYALSLFVTAVRVARLLRRLHVDVVHTHIYSSMIVFRIAGAIARVPIRVSMIPAPMPLDVPLMRRLDLATWRLDHRILGGCGYTSRRYVELGVPASRVRTVPYGIDPGGFDPEAANRQRVRNEWGISDDTPLVGQIAFFYPRLQGKGLPELLQDRGIKGHEDLLAAARLVIDMRPDVRFAVVGDGFGEAGVRYFDEMRQLAHELELDDAVFFAGRRKDLVDVIAALDVSVQCSLTENYGGTLESLAMERPMVATRVGGMPEVVIDGETGLLVPPRDPQALAAAILRLVDDPAVGRQLGVNGRSNVLAHHTIQRTVDDVVAVYAEIARERGIRRPPLDRDDAAAARDVGALGLMPSDVLYPVDETD